LAAGISVAKKDDGISLSALNITLIYLVVAALWIAFTDQLLNSLITDPEYLSTAQTYKGWIYVAVTSIGLFYLIKTHDRQITQKEDKISELSQKFQLEKELSDILFERIPVLITIFDPDLKSFEVNKEFYKVVGWSNTEIEEQDINLLEECYPNIETREEVVEFMKNPGVGWKEFTMISKSGNEIPVSWTNVRLTDNTSVGIGINMTEIKASQAKVRESQRLLKKSFESLQSSLILVNPNDRTIIDCNKATEDIFGYTKDELIGNSTKKLHVNEKSYQEFDELGEEALAETGGFQTEYQMQKKNGTIFHSNHTVSFVFDENGDVDCVVSVVRDITEQKEYQQQLEKRQERLQRSQKIGQIGDWEYDIVTGKITWSDTMYEIYERDPKSDPPSFEALMEHYHGSSSDNFKQVVQKAIEDKKSYDVDTELTTRNGNQKYIRAIGIPIEDETGETTKLLGIAQDITERKKSQRELEERKEFIETTLENLPIGVAVNRIDDGQVTLMNKQFSDIYGWPQEILTDVDSFFEHVYQDEEYRAQIRERVMEDMQSGDPERMQWKRIPITTQEGEQKVVNNRAIPLYDQNLMISTVIDVTKQHELEQELKLQNRKLEEAQEIAQMGYWEYDIESDEAPKWSENLYRIYGLDPDEYEATIESFLKMVHPDDEPDFDEFVKEVIESKSKSDTFRLTKPNGQTGYYHSRNELITDNEGHPSKILGIVHDITEIKRLEEKVIQSVIEAEDRERKRIASELHDGLGQYLVAANMNFQSVENNLEPLSEKRTKQFKTGLSHLKKALSETRNIAYNLMPKAIADYGLLTALENLIQDLRDSTKINVAFNYNFDELKLSEQGEINIYRILQEIISNAVRHSECSNISVILRKVEGNLKLMVKDDGKGAELDHAHDQQGLGLRSIKTRVNSLNGDLNIKSKPGEGMEISITIPNIGDGK
jgi:PAS domain S-box-containing protein